jgi:hypothetical protein
VVLRFLEPLGYLQSNGITLHDLHGPVLYHSPPATHQAGQHAPQWSSHLPRYTVVMPDNLELVVRAQVSRAILDGWDEVTRLLALTAVRLIVANGVAFWIIERALSPFPISVEGLERLKRGELDYRLPALGRLEAQAIGAPSTARRRRSGTRSRPNARRAARSDAMHGLIPRLSPLTLVTLGLAETLESLTRDLQQRHGSVTLSPWHDLRVDLGAPRDAGGLLLHAVRAHQCPAPRPRLAH